MERTVKEKANFFRDRVCDTSRFDSAKPITTSLKDFATSQLSQFMDQAISI